MSWHNRYLTGSFRGVPFYCESARGNGGRNVVVHEFPLQETHMLEDTGKKAGQRQLTLFALGADYDLARDALIAEFDKPGPGLLMHGDIGLQMMQVVDYDWEVSTRQGGYCRFTITVIPAGKTIAPVTRNTAVELNTAAQAAADEANQQFAKTLNTKGPKHIKTNALAQLQSAVSGLRRLNATISAKLQPLDDLSNAISEIGDGMAELINQPLQLGMKLEGIIASTLGAMGDIKSAFKAYKNLSVLFASSPAIHPAAANGVITPARQQMADNQQAIARTLNTHATLAMARQLTAQRPFSTADDALRVRDDLLQAIDALASSPGLSYVGYASMQNLQTAITRRVNDIAPGLDRAAHITLQNTLPALVVAYRHYGDALRSDELVQRNRIANPLFIPPGNTLEILL